MERDYAGKWRENYAACLGEKCVRIFFHAANEYLYFNALSLHVHLPKDAAELQASEEKFARCGFPGAFASMDVVHSPWRQCPTKFKHTCQGKEGFPTLAWNCGTDRNGLCVHISGPHHVFDGLTKGLREVLVWWLVFVEMLKHVCSLLTKKFS